MKTIKLIRLLQLVAVFALFEWSARAETVTHVTLKNGSTRFQIQGAAPNAPYRLRLEDLDSERHTEEVSAFKPGLVTGTLTGEAALKKQGVYLIRLFNGNNEITLRQSEINLPDIMNVENVTIDRKASTIRWRTPRSSLARVLAVLNNGMKIDTVAPWHFTSSAEQSGEWDFKDRVKVKSYRDHPNLQVYVQFVPLPDYLVVVGRPSLAQYQHHPLFKDLPLPVGENNITLEALSKEFRTVPSLPDERVPVVRAGSALRVKLDPSTKKKLGNNRYEIMFYAEGEFIHEESEGADPYTFLLPNLPRSSGLIYFSANLCDYRGNSGTSTIPAWYEADGQ